LRKGGNRKRSKKKKKEHGNRLSGTMERKGVRQGLRRTLAGKTRRGGRCGLKRTTTSTGNRFENIKTATRFRRNGLVQWANQGKKRAKERGHRKKKTEKSRQSAGAIKKGFVKNGFGETRENRLEVWEGGA